MRVDLPSGSLPCIVEYHIETNTYYGWVTGYNCVVSGNSVEEIERKLPRSIPKAVARRSQSKSFECVAVIAIDVSQLPRLDSTAEPCLPDATVRRLSAADVEGNVRQPLATYQTDVEVVEWLPELNLWYVRNEERSIFSVDEDTDVQIKLALGAKARALVTEEGHAQALFPVLGGMM